MSAELFRCGIENDKSRTHRDCGEFDVLYCLQVIVKPLRLRLVRIEEELRDVQRHFSSIDALLKLRRDDFTDVVRLNMLAAYEFLDSVLRDGVDFFSDEGLEGARSLIPRLLVSISFHIGTTLYKIHDSPNRRIVITKAALAVPSISL